MLGGGRLSVSLKLGPNPGKPGRWSTRLHLVEVAVESISTSSPEFQQRLNLFFGFLAILRCIQANYASDPALVSQYFSQAVWFILFSVVCDALDGRVARLGGRESLFGKEFDSIADIVSFGVAPTLMMIFLPNLRF